MISVIEALENMIKLANMDDDHYYDTDHRSDIKDAQEVLAYLKATNMPEEQLKRYNAQVILACKGDCSSVINLDGTCICPCADDTDCLASGGSNQQINQEVVRICKDYLGVKDDDGSASGADAGEAHDE